MSFKGPTRFPFQKHGAEFLSKRSHALLADEQGLGKTIQAIDAADAAMANRILVLCKRVGRQHWINQFRDFSNTHRTSQSIGATDRIDPNVDLTAVHYDVVFRPKLLRQLVKQKWDLIIADEMHVLKSGESSLRGQVILGTPNLGNKALLKGQKDLWLCNRTEMFWGLSGTPMPNHAGDLYAWLRSLHPELMPPATLDFDVFMRTFTACRESPYGGYQVFGNKSTNLFGQIIRQIMLRRRRKDVLPEMPDLLIDSMSMSGDPGKALKAWEGTEQADKIKDLLLGMDPEANPQEAAQAWGLDLSSLRRLTGMAKAVEAADVVTDELNSGAHEKVVVFGWHPDVLDTMAKILEKRGFGPIVLHGRSSDVVKDNAETWFQTDPNRRVLLGNILTAGTTITLTRAHRLFFVEASWVPGENEQAMLRILRIGQDKNCHVTFLSLANTIDDLVTAVFTRKAKMIDNIYQKAGVDSPAFQPT